MGTPIALRYAVLPVLSCPNSRQLIQSQFNPFKLPAPGKGRSRLPHSVGFLLRLKSNFLSFRFYRPGRLRLVTSGHKTLIISISIPNLILLCSSHSYHVYRVNQIPGSHVAIHILRPPRTTLHYRYRTPAIDTEIVSIISLFSAPATPRFGPVPEAFSFRLNFPPGRLALLPGHSYQRRQVQRAPFWPKLAQASQS